MSGRPRHEPTEQQRKQVEMMAGCGLVPDDIARVLGISAPTLRKWYINELETGHIKASAAVAASLYQKAMGKGQGSVTAAIFWLKCRCGWVDNRSGEDQPGKKEVQQAMAQTAARGTSWSDDMEFFNRAN